MGVKISPGRPQGVKISPGRPQGVKNRLKPCKYKQQWPQGCPRGAPGGGQAGGGQAGLKSNGVRLRVSLL